MNLLTAIQRLRSLLDIDEEDDRYPTETAKLHINEAIASIARSRDLEIGHTIFETTLSSGSSTLAVSTIEAAGYKVLSILKVWQSPYTEEYVIDDSEYQAMLDTYGDETGLVEAVALVGRTLHFRPIPTSDTPLRFLLRTRPIDLDLDASTNDWLETMEHEVLNIAAAHASMWLLEEQRAPGFFQLAEAGISSAALVDSQKVDGTRMHMEEIG